MSSPSGLQDPNKLRLEQRELLRALTDVRSLIVLHFLRRKSGATLDQIARDLSFSPQSADAITTSLVDVGLISEQDGRFALTQTGARQLVDYRDSYARLPGTVIRGQASSPHPLPGEYELQKLIGQGATSSTFLAIQRATHRARTLKLFYPGIVGYDRVDEALRKRAAIENAAIPDVLESGEVEVSTSGETISVPCVVLQHVDLSAQTFAKFVEAHQNPSPKLFERFVERVGGALAAIESAGLSHGDLHEGNILVQPRAGDPDAPEFWVIDFVGVPSYTSKALVARTDLDNFRAHLLRAALMAVERRPGTAIRVLLGDRVSRVLDGLRATKFANFREMMQEFSRDPKVIPVGYFRPPAAQPFEWLRAEWIPSPDKLYKLFAPVPSRFRTIARFGNTWISGPRGCGKSHYLRVLAFQPEAILLAENDRRLAGTLEALDYDYRRSFGILFACRLGEFKFLSPEAIGKRNFDLDTQRFIKHILVLKIINKAFEALKSGMFATRKTGEALISIPRNLKPLVAYLEHRLGPIHAPGSEGVLDKFTSLAATCEALENSAVAIWHIPNERARSVPHLLDEKDLDQFFRVVSATFDDLTESKFYVLVDDASYGHIDAETQKVLNSLVRAAQSHHCFKITCEKYMYTLDTSDGRAIDPRHEITYVDLGEISTKRQKRNSVNLSNYMAEVVDRRLAEVGYRRTIKELLGESQNVEQFLSGLSSSELPPGDEKKVRAYYGGWNIVWSLSHGSIRTLLEMIEQIFKQNDVNENTEFIKLFDQDAAIRGYSERQFRALQMLPGHLDGSPAGPRLQAIVSAIGRMSRAYLTSYDTGDPHRWYETISVERLDRRPLDPTAEAILVELVKYGLLLDDGITFSRAQFGLSQRYDLNKVFAPAFRVTYRVRNHIYVSHARFEELLSTPDLFVKRHQSKLRELAEGHQRRQRDLRDFTE